MCISRRCLNGMMEIKTTFHSRPRGYKAGVCLMLLALVLFSVSFALPIWMRFEDESYPGIFDYHGLWKYCSDPGTFFGARPPTHAHNEACRTFRPKHYAAWFHVVRVLESLCQAGLIVACVYAAFTNCCRPVAGRHLEIIIALSGVLGFTGCMLFLAMLESDHTILVSFRRPVGQHFLALAFYLATAATILAVIAAVLIAVFNKPLSTPTSNLEDAVVYTPDAATQGQGQGSSEVGGSLGQGLSSSDRSAYVGSDENLLEV